MNHHELYINEDILLVVDHHVVECLVELVGTALDLQLLPVDLVFNVVHLKGSYYFIQFS